MVGSEGMWTNDVYMEITSLPTVCLCECVCVWSPRMHKLLVHPLRRTPSLLIHIQPTNISWQLCSHQLSLLLSSTYTQTHTYEDGASSELVIVQQRPSLAVSYTWCTSTWGTITEIWLFSKLRVFWFKMTCTDHVHNKEGSISSETRQPWSQRSSKTLCNTWSFNRSR